MENYLNVLEESLRKKRNLLGEIQDFNTAHEALFRAEDPDLERFDSYLEEKERLITELDQLDEGFETLYAQVAEELKENRERYAEQIRTLQGLVKEVTDKTVIVQAQEARSKARLEEFFRGRRSEIRSARVGSRAAMSYYQIQNPNGLNSGNLYEKR